MSFASMQGRSMYIGSTIGEGALRFSDGTVQQTAYPGASELGDITCDTLTVSESAIIGSGTSDDTTSLTIYGTAQQVIKNDDLSDSLCTQYGSNSLTNLTTGLSNTAFGYNSLTNNTGGYYNTGVGNNALYTNSDGTYNTATGYYSQTYGTGDYNTSIGAFSLQGINTFDIATGSYETTGSYNTSVGYLASTLITSGEYNTSLGYNSNTNTTTATNTTAIGSGANCNNFTESTAIGYNATNTASNQLMLATSAETVQINGTLNVGTNFNSSNTLNILGGLSVNNIPGNGSGATNVINGSTNTIVGQTQNLLSSALNTLNSSQTTITGDCSIGTYNTTTTTTINGNSTIGSSSSNTSTVNAVPNFVNGFRCAGATAYTFFMGTATSTGSLVDDYGSSGNQIPPNLNSGGTAYGSYTLDQSISNIIGCFINPVVNTYTGSGSLYPLVSTWYFNQISSTQINVAIVNLATNYEPIPTTVYYMAFCASS